MNQLKLLKILLWSLIPLSIIGTYIVVWLLFQIFHIPLSSVKPETPMFAVPLIGALSWKNESN